MSDEPLDPDGRNRSGGRYAPGREYESPFRFQGGCTENPNLES